MLIPGTHPPAEVVVVVVVVVVLVGSPVLSVPVPVSESPPVPGAGFPPQARTMREQEKAQVRIRIPPEYHGNRCCYKKSGAFCTRRR